jgi:ribose 5-phosphate isomerase
LSDNLKRAAAERAAELVTHGMRLGLGTGSTAAYFVAAIGERVRGGLKVVGVPTSEATRDQAQREGIPLSTLDETPDLDLTVDGADELDDDLRLRRAADGAPYVTDGGHFIFDAHLGRIDKPNVLASTLNNIPGVVEHGLFLGLATGAILASGDGLVELGQL